MRWANAMVFVSSASRPVMPCAFILASFAMKRLMRLMQFPTGDRAGGSLGGRKMWGKAFEPAAPLSEGP